jgi:hypothetical protein
MHGVPVLYHVKCEAKFTQSKVLLSCLLLKLFVSMHFALLRNCYQNVHFTYHVCAWVWGPNLRNVSAEQVPASRQATPASSLGADPLDRFGAVVDRWEPGSDFESKTVTRHMRRRVEEAADADMSDAPAAVSQPEAASRSVSGSVEVKAGLHGSVNRLELCLACVVLFCFECCCRFSFALAVCQPRLLAACLAAVEHHGRQPRS